MHHSQHWDEIIKNDAQIIDMRNNFEYNLGTFKGAINLCLINFTDLKDKTAELNKLDRKKKTAIFCTGGIRCERLENTSVILVLRIYINFKAE